MKLICFCFCLLGILLHVNTSAQPSNPPITLDFNAVPGHPIAPNGLKFLPVNYPLMGRIRWPGDVSNGIPVIRLVDAQNTEIDRLDLAFPLKESGPERSIDFLLTIPPLPHSQFIRFEIAFRESGSDLCVESTHLNWQHIRTDYALMRAMLPRLSRGWHPVDRSTPLDPAGRWSMLASTLEFTDPLRPMILNLSGTTNPQCLDNKQLRIDLFRAQEHLCEELVERSEFTIRTVIQPRVFPRDPMHSAPECPLGNTPVWVLLKADQDFIPSDCSGSNDTRRLSFSLREIQLAEWIPISGFYPGKSVSESLWSSPTATFMVPNPGTSATLFFQGHRDVQCIKEPQTITLFLNKTVLLTETVSTPRFCLQVPITAAQLGMEPLIMIEFSVNPLFFRSQCSDTDDSNPYGVAIDALFLQGNVGERASEMPS